MKTPDELAGLEAADLCLDDLDALEHRWPAAYAAVVEAVSCGLDLQRPVFDLTRERVLAWP